MESKTDLQAKLNTFSSVGEYDLKCNFYIDVRYLRPPISTDQEVLRRQFEIHLNAKVHRLAKEFEQKINMCNQPHKQ